MVTETMVLNLATVEHKMEHLVRATGYEKVKLSKSVWLSPPKHSITGRFFGITGRLTVI